MTFWSVMDRVALPFLVITIIVLVIGVLCAIAIPSQPKGVMRELLCIISVLAIVGGALGSLYFAYQIWWILNTADLAEIVTKSLIGPILFITAGIILFSIICTIFYKTLLKHVIPKNLAVLLGVVGSVAILYGCTENYEWVKAFVKQFL